MKPALLAMLVEGAVALTTAPVVVVCADEVVNVVFGDDEALTILLVAEAVKTPQAVEVPFARQPERLAD